MDRIIIFMRVGIGLFGTWVNVTHCGVTDGREFTDLVFRIPNEKKHLCVEKYG
jgi:hypothetical protein